ncbi:potassium transport protein Kup [Variovorax paradoxus]|nr:potassium transport protein Kup [Variovorax paradoxus]KPV05028.1 potassium transport protein Kup [Variovorax paradoxus]KPV09462.1 potassium transport protein Kup [Variovorax paradoxus]KPV23147.1 potassium transport protein Kup [Variovorax paradoxus]KPV28686.1 potassium transport protein Kup [Variovorax paradoxus]
MIAALGVVFGDIGTSPLYAFKETLNPEHGVPFSPDAVLGLLSLIFWGLLFVVTLKYVVFVLRADHDGEGGILALQALARNAASRIGAKPWLGHAIGLLGLVGAAMFYGDSLITPAISVLSAVEGLEVRAPVLERAVLPITVAILIALFAVQKKGTGAVGKVFGPVMLLWFVVIGVAGLMQVLAQPQVLAALDPRRAVLFLVEHRLQSLAVLGAVFLAFTGGEALYADMGHFGARPIRLAWLFIALPGLVLNYFGQGALVLANPQAIDNPFFRLFPAWGVLPMVLLAAMATVIASQAVISGAFSLTAHAMRMGYLPRMRVIQTSGTAIGQIYVPTVNWLLMVGVLLLVLGFRSSSALSAAYGIAVSITMVTTTLLAGIVAWGLWRWNKPAVALGVAAFAAVDLTFVVANSLKVAEGGWLTLAVAAGVMLLFTTWAKGRRLGLEAAAAESLPLRPFFESLAHHMPHRVQGTAVFLNVNVTSVPHALLHNLKHNQVLHEQVIVLRVLPCDTPRVDARLRIEAESLMTGIWIVTARHGFMERPDVPEFIRILAYQKTLAIDSMKTSYFVSRASVGEEHLPGLNPIRRALFGWLQRNAGRASDYFELPDNRLVEMGQRT